ncbi:MAG: phosphoribosylformylglycinamidine synthase subunit PurS [Bacteroidetes bacterium]|jgi:phosphoribosylformylglycinamidine synthase|nr:phosphoribosylformylglycinamidine synthase subunit PurS [Bacteroidota bacterium]
MNFRAEIDVMPLKELLDPQGKAVEHGLQKLNFKEVADVRIGKHITIKLTADSKEAATAKVEEACKKLLANPIMEGYKFELVAE